MEASIVESRDPADTPSTTLMLRAVDALGELHEQILQDAELLNFVLSMQEPQDDHPDHPMSTVLRQALTERTAAMRSAVRRAAAIVDQAQGLTNGGAS